MYRWFPKEIVNELRGLYPKRTDLITFFEASTEYLYYRDEIVKIIKEHENKRFGAVQPEPLGEIKQVTPEMKLVPIAWQRRERAIETSAWLPWRFITQTDYDNSRKVIASGLEPIWRNQMRVLYTIESDDDSDL